jgi:hypothetical protein
MKEKKKKNTGFFNKNQLKELKDFNSGKNKIVVKSEFSPVTLVHALCRNVSSKLVLHYLLNYYLLEASPYAFSTLGMLADKEDVDKVKLMFLLRFIIKNWNNEELLKQQAKEIARSMEKK